ncbi:hypothetical protein PCURB6_12790 [Paenibacillus curdlanolyticus]|nr:hypothetical protein PCURB6_12790 [Paenibacillus curdlanolyticus]
MAAPSGVFRCQTACIRSAVTLKRTSYIAAGFNPWAGCCSSVLRYKTPSDRIIARKEAT